MSFFSSSTQSVPVVADQQPRHIAIIMDGNGRWAKKRFLPRVAGHVKGVDTVRDLVRFCLDQNIPYLTLFAFSSENWRRPQEEVSLLMQLFMKALEQEVERLDRNQVRLRVVGDLSKFDEKIQSLVKRAELQTERHSRLNLTIAANYGGRWDIVHAMNQLAISEPEKVGLWTEEDLAKYLSLSFAPEPDLFIRTGGEQRVSNFLLWQLAYTEFYFTDTLWPEFGSKEFEDALNSFRQRERRFGRTSEQLSKE